MDVNKLLQALDDDTNENLLDFTSDKMREMNLKILNFQVKHIGTFQLQCAMVKTIV